MINAIDIIAAREGKNPEEIREAIQETLELAWASGDSNHIQARKKLSDSPTAPNLDEFIAAVVKEVQNRR
jgi:hypothetical protein